MPRLPKDMSKPFTVNGIKFANREECDRRKEEDISKMAEFLYDIYKKRKRRDS